MTAPAPAEDHGATTADASGTDRRGYGVALAVLAVGGLLLLLAHGRAWAGASVGGSGLPTVQVSLTGSDINPAGTAVAVLALAGVAGLLATRRVGRILIGLLLILAGAVSVVTAAQFGVGRMGVLVAGDSLTDVVTDHVGVDAVGGTVAVTGWWIAAVVGGALVAAAGVLAVVRSSRWPQLGRRYERTTSPVSEGSASAAAGPAARHESAWDQMDRGVDPTVGSGSGPSDTMTTSSVEEDPHDV